MGELEESRTPRRGWRIALVSLVVFGLATGVAGCTTPTGAPAPAPSTSAQASPTPTVAAEPATVVLTPEKDATFVNPVSEVLAVVDNGTVYNAVLKETATGEVIDGERDPSGSKWSSKTPLKFDTAYTLDVTVVNPEGDQSNRVSTFNTVPASHEADAILYPGAGSTVGVGQPLEFNFSEPVANKEAVENAIKITTSTGQVGAFRWYTDQMVRYRAADYWPANSQVNVDMKLLGIDIGNGMIANFNKNYNVNIGNKVVMEADAANMSVSILVNDQVARTFSATLGDTEFPSASGYIVITADKQRYATFKAASIGLKPGDPGDYGSVDVEFATRLSKSGIFIHQATASAMPYLGVANLSHGCIGLSAEGAGWVFQNMRAGDLVHTVGTPNETIAPTDGFGDWNIPFEQYASR
ncbi:Ig-like domain-containing protein [Arthrobacter sp. TMP15]|uniref:L,D-transpeptidase n=1 Tax=Arthrobacter sp. TMP15 TaxID=3140789 RepID=UPI0031BA176F